MIGCAMLGMLGLGRRANRRVVRPALTAGQVCTSVQCTPTDYYQPVTSSSLSVALDRPKANKY